MIHDISVLKEIDDKVNHIHTELLQTASTNLSSEQIPVMKCLMADESNEYKQRIHLISRANQLTKKYRTIHVKRKSNVSTCPLPLKQLKVKEDPLNKASRRSVGRPKGKQIKNSLGKPAGYIFTFYVHVRIIGTDVDNDPDMICNVKKETNGSSKFG